MPTTGACHVHPRARRSCQVRTISSAASVKFSPRAMLATVPVVESATTPKAQSSTERPSSPSLPIP